VQGASMTFKLTFYNSAGTLLGTATSPASAIAAGTGFSACAQVGSANATNVEAEIKQALGTASATGGDKNADGKVNVVDVQTVIGPNLGCTSTNIAPAFVGIATSAYPGGR
jgi:hypothetical protein